MNAGSASCKLTFKSYRSQIRLCVKKSSREYTNARPAAGLIVATFKFVKFFFRFFDVFAKQI